LAHHDTAARARSRSFAAKRGNGVSVDPGAENAKFIRVMRRTLALGVVAAVAFGAVVACGSSVAANSSFGPGGATDGPSSSADAGAATPASNLDVESAVILVHAAKLPSFRLCFENELDRRPQPDSQLMPEANVVGLDVGNTARLGALRGAPGRVFLFEEGLIRAYYPQFGGAGLGPTCELLLSPGNPLAQSALEVGRVDKDLSSGIHLLVVRGCPAKGKLVNFSVEECGSDWTEPKGNLGIAAIELSATRRQAPGRLPVQVVHLSQGLETARVEARRTLDIRFGVLSKKSAELTRVATNPPLFGRAVPVPPAELVYTPDDQTIYGTTGFRVSLVASAGVDASADEVLAEATLDHVQRLSSSLDVPTTYFSAASNYVLLLLGDPRAKLADGGASTDERERLHWLAIPVVAPKSDAGTDSAAP
jgi:hypothetical protein